MAWTEAGPHLYIPMGRRETKWEPKFIKNMSKWYTFSKKKNSWGLTNSFNSLQELLTKKQKAWFCYHLCRYHRLKSGTTWWCGTFNDTITSTVSLKCSKYSYSWFWLKQIILGGLRYTTGWERSRYKFENLYFKGRKTKDWEETAVTFHFFLSCLLSAHEF